jgi:hypothetical protein
MAARRAAEEADKRLARYREALDAGAEPSVVAEWIREATAERERAKRLRERSPAPQSLTVQDVRALVSELGDVGRVIEEADPNKKAEIYESLRLSLTYDPEPRKVLVEADLRRVQDRVGGPKAIDCHSPPDWRVRPWRSREQEVLTSVPPRPSADQAHQSSVCPGGRRGGSPP